MTAAVSPRIVALLTDFGGGGPYVGAMKGAVLSVCPQAVLVDLTHEIPPQDITTGGAHLLATVPYFPRGTTVLAVVDPGVGTNRRGIAAEAGGYTFVGPDNGLLAPVLDELGADVIVSLDDPRFARTSVSQTFEGRDRFGPAAGWIAAGTPVRSLGSLRGGYVRLDARPPAGDADRLRGEVVWVDRFGNLVTNVSRNVWERDGQGREGDVVLDGVLVGRPVRTYAAVPVGEACVLFGSTEQLEIAVRDGSAATRFDASAGSVVEIVWR